MDKKLKKLNRSIKIRSILLSICIGIGFGLMGLDYYITRDFFRHNDTTMLISIMSLGAAIYIDSTIRRLKSERKKLENESSRN